MVTAIMYRVSWNEGAAKAIGRFALYACLLLAVTLAVPVVVAAVTPVAVGCCSFVVANAWQLALVPVVFGGFMAVKP